MPKRRFLVIMALLLTLTSVIAGCGLMSSNARVANQLDVAVKYLSENKFDEAILAYKEVIKIDQKNVTAYEGISLAFIMQGKKAEAEQVLQEGLKIIPDNKPLKLAMAGLYVDMNMKDQAEKIYKELIAQDGTYLPSYQAYSRFLLNHDRLIEAVSLLEKATQANTDQYGLYSILAELYWQSGNKEMTQSAAIKSITIEPNQSVAYKVLERLYANQWTDLVALGDRYIQQEQVKLGHILKMMGLYGAGDFDGVIGLYLASGDDVKSVLKARLITSWSFIKTGKKDTELSILKGINFKDLRDAYLLAELAEFYLKTGNKEMAREAALAGISIDETLIYNYIVIYKSYEDEDNNKAKVWEIKCAVNSFGIDSVRNIKLAANEEIILQTAQKYLAEQNVHVIPYRQGDGLKYGEDIIVIDNIWGDRAVLYESMFASEPSYEIGVQKNQDGKWEVVYVDLIYSATENGASEVDDNLMMHEYDNIRSLFNNKEGFRFENKPGAYKIGIKAANSQRIVALIAPYGEHWKWAYNLENISGLWDIVKKEDAHENPHPFKKGIAVSSETQKDMPLSDKLFQIEGKPDYLLWKSKGVRNINDNFNTIKELDYDDSGNKLTIKAGYDSPNGTKIIAYVTNSKYGQNLIYSRFEKLKAYDGIGDLKEGYSIQVSTFDFDNDGKNEVVAAIGNGTTELGIGIFRYTGGDSDKPFKEIGFINGQTNAIITRDGVIKTTVNSQELMYKWNGTEFVCQAR